MAEWRALMDPATETGVAHLKLDWWREEIRRWGAGAPVHPVTRYLARLENANALDPGPLRGSIDAAAAQVAGVPLERAVELQSHADALYGVPLRTAAALAGIPGRGDLDACTAALATGEYLARAVEDHARQARAGRIPFAVDELLAAGIDNEDLAAAVPPPRLQEYLTRLRRAGESQFANAGAALGPDVRADLRHLRVLAVLGATHLNDRRRADFALSDLYNAWTAARRAAAGR